MIVLRLTLIEFITVESISQVKFLYSPVAYDFGRSSGAYHLAVVNYVCFVNHLKSSLDVMVGNENAHPAGNKLADFLPDAARWAPVVRVLDPLEWKRGETLRLNASAPKQRVICYWR